mmetsp:Transcript_97807/g.276675  ORF Transcript_97807/g.276675 Transcript_97807/m.276675 type:complete len:263 (-) Transcript_97807:16-804(-)
MNSMFVKPAPDGPTSSAHFTKSLTCSAKSTTERPCSWMQGVPCPTHGSCPANTRTVARMPAKNSSSLTTVRLLAAKPPPLPEAAWEARAAPAIWPARRATTTSRPTPRPPTNSGIERATSTSNAPWSRRPVAGTALSFWPLPGTTTWRKHRILLKCAAPATASRIRTGAMAAPVTMSKRPRCHGNEVAFVGSTRTTWSYGGGGTTNPDPGPTPLRQPRRTRAAKTGSTSWAKWKIFRGATAGSSPRSRASGILACCDVPAPV